jgi:hypothetical protein
MLPSFIEQKNREQRTCPIERIKVKRIAMRGR